MKARQQKSEKNVEIRHTLTGVAKRVKTILKQLLLKSPNAQLTSNPAKAVASEEERRTNGVQFSSKGGNEAK